MGVNTRHKIEQYKSTNSASLWKLTMVVIHTKTSMFFFPTMRPAQISGIWSTMSPGGQCSFSSSCLKTLSCERAVKVSGTGYRWRSGVQHCDSSSVCLCLWEWMLQHQQLGLITGSNFSVFIDQVVTGGESGGQKMDTDRMWHRKYICFVLFFSTSSWIKSLMKSLNG